MKALVFQNKVIQIEEEEFPVAAGLMWVDCGENVAVGFGYDGEFQPPPVYSPPKPDVSDIDVRLAALEAKVGVTAQDKTAARAALINKLKGR